MGLQETPMQKSLDRRGRECSNGTMNCFLNQYSYEMLEEDKSYNEL